MFNFKILYEGTVLYFFNMYSPSTMSVIKKIQYSSENLGNTYDEKNKNGFVLNCKKYFVLNCRKYLTVQDAVM